MTELKTDDAKRMFAIDGATSPPAPVGRIAKTRNDIDVAGASLAGQICSFVFPLSASARVCFEESFVIAARHSVCSAAAHRVLSQRCMVARESRGGAVHGAVLHVRPLDAAAILAQRATCSPRCQ